jgi:predicted RNA-binding protein with PIN domain
MQYYIDGYNLLFKEAWARSAPSLEEARKRLILELDTLASTLNLSLTIVFDAPFQSDDLRRGHFQSLEIIFTAQGQSADDYLEALAYAYGKKAHIVTSDRALASKVKANGAHVEGVHHFLINLRKKWQNKRARTKLPPPPPVKKEAPPATPKPEKPLDMNNLPPLSDLPAWEQIFLKRLTS